jgi:hypothetical protein
MHRPKLVLDSAHVTHGLKEGAFRKAKNDDKQEIGIQISSTNDMAQLAPKTAHLYALLALVKAVTFIP